MAHVGKGVDCVVMGMVHDYLVYAFSGQTISPQPYNTWCAKLPLKEKVSDYGQVCTLHTNVFIRPIGKYMPMIRTNFRHFCYLRFNYNLEAANFFRKIYETSYYPKYLYSEIKASKMFHIIVFFS